MVLSGIIFFQSCATSPWNVFPHAVTIDKNQSCDVLQERLATLNTRNKELRAHQQRIYRRDSTYLGLSIGLGLVTFLVLGLFAVGIQGDDAGTLEYAEVQGERNAINQVVKNKCS